MKKYFFKTMIIAAIALVSVSAFCQSPISPVPAGGANAYPGGTPTQSPSGITPGSSVGNTNVGAPAPIGNGYVGNPSNSGTTNPAAVPGSPASGTGATSPVNAGSTIPQNTGVNDARNSSIPPHKE